MVSKIFRNLSTSVVLYWLVAFLIINILCKGTGGVNALSRFATMRAMVDQGTFRIDDYKSWTIDWARTPDGHFYSNKAPGPMFIGLPLFFLMEQVTKINKADIVNEKGVRLRPVGQTVQFLMSLSLQVIPFMILLAFVIRHMQEQGNSVRSISFTTLAMLFGNTISVYLNLWFGHGMASIFLLSLVMAIIHQRWLLAGLFYGLALLCDFGVGVMLLPFLGVLVWKNGKRVAWTKSVLLGGLIPGILWTWYHISCFGSPFALPAHFQNPMFKDVTETANVWGVFHINFQPQVMFELLFGPMRGLLFTQPWMLMALPFLGWILFKKKGTLDNRQLIFFGLTSFALIFLLNSFFGGWHGGWAAGPRYMSIIFPVIVFLTGMNFDSAPLLLKRALFVGLAISILYHFQVFATTTLIPEGNAVWSFQWHHLLSFRSIKLWFKLLACFAIFGIASWLQFKKFSAHKSP